jgi:hypothetical protein
VKKLDGNDPNFLPTTHGPCITTMHLLTRALHVRESLACKQITVLEHPPYSSDLAPNDLFLFPKIKKILKRRHFDIRDMSNTTVVLKAISKLF